MAYIYIFEHACRYILQRGMSQLHSQSRRTSHATKGHEYLLLPNGSCRMATRCLCQLLITFHGCQMACHVQVLSKALSTVAGSERQWPCKAFLKANKDQQRLRKYIPLDHQYHHRTLHVLSCSQLNFSGGFVSMPQPTLCKNIGVEQWQWLSQIGIYRDH